MSPSSKTASRALPTACRINLTQRRQDAKETHVLSEFGGKAVHLVGLRRSLVRVYGALSQRTFDGRGRRAAGIRAADCGQLRRDLSVRPQDGKGRRSSAPSRRRVLAPNEVSLSHRRNARARMAQGKRGRRTIVVLQDVYLRPGPARRGKVGERRHHALLLDEDAVWIHVE